MSFDPKLMGALAGLHFKARYLMEGYLNGAHDSPFHGFSVEFSECRGYQPGDELRHVDWRLFARTDRLCIKRYEQDTNARFYVLLDSSASMGYRGDQAWGSKFECATAVASALGGLMLKQNDAVGLLALEAKGAELQAAYLAPSQKPSQFGTLLRHMQKLQPTGGERLGELLTCATRTFARRSVILLFSDLLEDSVEIATLFKQLRFLGHECLVFQTLDRDELEFPFSRPQVFRDMETGVERQVQPEAVRARYLERFGQFMAGQREFFRSQSIPYCVMRTDQSPAHALREFFAKRKRLN